MLMCNHVVSFDDVKVLASNKTTFLLKIKIKNILLSRDQRILNETSLKLCLFDQLQSQIAIELLSTLP